MLLKLDVESEIPLYEQIVRQIMEGLATNKLKPGDPLPSVRSLAADVGINYLTVNKAYQLLKEKGFIHIHRQKGVVIKSEGFPEADATYLQQLQNQMKPVIVEAVCRGMTDEQVVQMSRDILDMIKKERSE